MTFFIVVMLKAKTSVSGFSAEEGGRQMPVIWVVMFLNVICHSANSDNLVAPSSIYLTLRILVNKATPPPTLRSILGPIFVKFWLIYPISVLISKPAVTDNDISLLVVFVFPQKMIFISHWQGKEVVISI